MTPLDYSMEEYLEAQQRSLEKWLWRRFPNQPVRIALLLRILNGTRY